MVGKPLYGKEKAMNQKKTDPERFQRQLDFCLKIDQEKNVLRQTHLSGHGRRENDAEHAWHMAVMAYILREYSNEEIDVGKTLLLCLIHDLVEIEAGDTYAYDDEGKKTQEMREKSAEQHLFSLLPEDQMKEISALFEEFDRGSSPEAKFAREMDNLQPFLLNDSNGGTDWTMHGIYESQVLERQKKAAGASDVLMDYLLRRIHANADEGHLRR